MSEQVSSEREFDLTQRVDTEFFSRFHAFLGREGDGATFDTFTESQFDREMKGPLVVGFLISEIEGKNPFELEHLVTLASEMSSQPEDQSTLGRQIFRTLEAERDSDGRLRSDVRRQLVQKARTLYKDELLVIEAENLEHILREHSLDDYALDTLAAAALWLDAAREFEQKQTTVHTPNTTSAA